MKVLKKQDVSGWSYKHTCANCDTELEVEASDLRYHRYDGDCREPGYDSFTANCSVCSQSFTVLTTKIPKLIQLEAKNRSSSGGGGWYDR